MSEFALKVKNYYETGLWSRERIEKALELGRITKKEYQLIIHK